MIINSINLTHIKYMRFACALFFMAITNLHAETGLTSQAQAEGTPHSSKSGPIVVSVKPLYSLVSHLTHGIEAPVLLMKRTQSPHHYSIRPSERRLLANARMIIWLGPQMEAPLTGIIQQSSSPVVSAMQAKDLKLLENRSKHSSHDHHATDNDKAESNNAAPDDIALLRVDPHIWLSTHNAAAISRHISQQLIANDPENTEKYRGNLQRLLDKIKQTARFIKVTLKDAGQPFLAYHDAFQYFENEASLNYIASITADDETGTSLKYMREITEKIAEQQITCLVYQPPKPAIIDSLAGKHAMNAVMLDALGITVNEDENAWFELMHSLAINFNKCLKTRPGSDSQ